MLTNTLKRLVYWARSSKRPTTPAPDLQQPTSNNDNNSGFSHPISPTLRKIDKRYNQSQQKQLKQQQDMMRSFEQIKRSMFVENQNRKRTKEEQVREAEERLERLEVPGDLRVGRSRGKGREQGLGLGGEYGASKYPKHLTKEQRKELEQSERDLIRQFEEDNDNQSESQIDLNSIKVEGRGIKSQQEAEMFKKMAFAKEMEEDPFVEQRLKQDILLSEILKGAKQKEVELNLPKDWKKELEEKKKQREEEDSLLNEKMRYEKLKQLSQQQQQQPGNPKKSKSSSSTIESNSQLKRLHRLADTHKVEITPDEIWRSKYPPQLIEKAMDYKNRQLHYFKQLVQGDRRDQWDYIREASQLKQRKEDKEKRRKDRELIAHDREEKNKQLGETVQGVEEQGVIRYQDLEYYKEKGVKEWEKRENLYDYDVELRQAAKKDLEQVNKLSGIYMDDFEDKEERRLYFKEKYEESTFGKYETKLKQLSTKMQSLGIKHDYQDLALLKKQELFADKKMQQQNESYKQYLIKKEKKKQMKEQLKRVHKEKLREDLNFDYELDPVKLEKLDPLEMEEGLKKMEEIRKMKESTIVSGEFLKEKIHHIKTLKAMGQFITAYFYNNLQNANNTITEKVQIGNILANRKNTVLNIFWQFHPTYMKLMLSHRFTPSDQQRQKQTLQKILQKQSSYISSKMTTYLGLRYGPDIRFQFNEILDETKKSYEEMKQHKDEIIELTVEEYKEKGVIKTQVQEDEYRRKIGVLVENNLQDLNNQKKLVSKGYVKKLKLEKKLQARKEHKAAKTRGQTLEYDPNHQNYATKKARLSQKELSQVALNKIITQKVQKKKEGFFTSYVEDEALLFGEEHERVDGGRKKGNEQGGEKVGEGKVQRKGKRSPVERLWEEIQRGSL